MKNIRPGFKWGLWLGLANAAMETYVYPWLWGGPPWTVPHNVQDNEATKPASSCKPIDYPKCARIRVRPCADCVSCDACGKGQPVAIRTCAWSGVVAGCVSCDASTSTGSLIVDLKKEKCCRPDGQITFDIATSLHHSGTSHDHDQPPHLHLKSSGVVETVNAQIYDGPEKRYCPAGLPLAGCVLVSGVFNVLRSGVQFTKHSMQCLLPQSLSSVMINRCAACAGVYEHTNDANTGRTRLQVNAQNCLHCKACDIKDPTQNIVWTVPEGGGGPNYTVM